MCQCRDSTVINSNTKITRSLPKEDCLLYERKPPRLKELGIASDARGERKMHTCHILFLIAEINVVKCHCQLLFKKSASISGFST